MHANYLVVNHGCARQTVESVAELLPHLHRKSSTALIVETVNPINSGTFMVASQQKEVFGVLNFVCKEKTNNFD